MSAHYRLNSALLPLKKYPFFVFAFEFLRLSNSILTILRIFVVKIVLSATSVLRTPTGSYARSAHL